MRVNVKLLKKVRKLIAEEPRRLQMGNWGIKWTKAELKHAAHLPPCGTTACLAGWAILASHKKSGWRRLFDGDFIRTNVRGVGIRERAAKLLGLPMEQCPFNQVMWEKPEVLAWIDRQIDAASK